MFEALGLYGTAQAKSKRKRVASLGGLHERVVGNCFVYRVLISDLGKIRSIDLLLRKGWEMPPSIPWPTSVVTPGSLYATETDLLVSALRNQYHSFPFSVQFQVQRFAQNGYLTPARVLELLPCMLGRLFIARVASRLLRHFESCPDNFHLRAPMSTARCSPYNT